MVIQYEEQEREKQEASRKIKVDAAEGAVLKNISLIQHGAHICSLSADMHVLKWWLIALQRFQSAEQKTVN